MSASTGNFRASSRPISVRTFADIDAADDAVRPREIDILEHAKRRLLIRERPLRAQAVFVDDEHFAGLDLANELGVNEIERARFGSEI